MNTELYLGRKIYLVLTFSFLFSNIIFGQIDGEELYKTNCTACHLMTDKRLVGPGLKGVTDKYSKEWLKKWIINSQEFIASGDEKAIAIYEEYNKQIMPAFYFSDEEFDALFAYLEAPPVEDVVETYVASAEQVSTSNKYLPIILLISILTLAYVLLILKNKLKLSLGEETESIPQTFYHQYKLFISNKTNLVFTGIVAFVVISNFAYSTMMGIGVYTQYQPEQPIAFSHELHSGINGVDCNYCHSSARHSKHSGIPSANVCMNCHTYINEGTDEEGTKEIAKIYEAVGFDPDSRTYIEGYTQKPIEWVRIHNLPDHAYFNHSQHVVAGQIECQECHGPIQEMEEVYQYSELTMGWCIECHRESEVKMEGNEYYAKIHDELKEKYGKDVFTVEEIGGLECAKCHY
tara:strand:+ start:3232 stop:4446 length:1215 start_codon:yes stop_codon:yes gene_type:complete